MTILEEIKKTLVEFMEKEIVLPTRVKVEYEEYKVIPLNLAEIDSREVGKFLTVWTRLTNWSGYNLSVHRVVLDRIKSDLNRLRIILTQQYSLDSKTKAEAERKAEADIKVQEMETELNQAQMHYTLLSAIHEANIRNMNLVSREISRRSNDFSESNHPRFSESREVSNEY